LFFYFKDDKNIPLVEQWRRVELNGEPKELEMEQKNVGTVNREHARSGERRKVKVKMRGGLKQPISRRL